MRWILEQGQPTYDEDWATAALARRRHVRRHRAQAPRGPAGLRRRGRSVDGPPEPHAPARDARPIPEAGIPDAHVRGGAVPGPRPVQARERQPRPCRRRRPAHRDRERSAGRARRPTSRHGPVATSSWSSARTGNTGGCRPSRGSQRIARHPVRRARRLRVRHREHRYRRRRRAFEGDELVRSPTPRRTEPRSVAATGTSCSTRRCGRRPCWPSSRTPHCTGRLAEDRAGAPLPTDRGPR